MKINWLIFLTIAAFLAATGSTPQCLAQAPKAAEKPSAPATKALAPVAKSMKLTIIGKIAKTERGYIIQGQKPPELFTIYNPNPKVLDRLVKSGKTVTIQAVSVIGDNLNIQKINGKTYKEAKAGKTKGQ